jgi:hypothetical protein
MVNTIQSNWASLRLAGYHIQALKLGKAASIRHVAPVFASCKRTDGLHHRKSQFLVMLLFESEDR